MTKQIRADFLLLLITAIWGASFPLMKNVLDHIPSFAYLALRFIIATLVLLIIFYNKLHLTNKKIIKYGAAIGLMLFAGMALQVSGLYFTTASNSAFITGLNVIMVPVVSAVFLRKKPDLFSTVGVLLAFAGLFFLSGGLSFRFNLGDFLTLLCAVCFSMQIIFIDKFTNNEDPALLAVLQLAFAALFCSGAWVFEGFKPFELNATVIFTLLFTGIMGTALAFAGQTIVQRFTTPTHTALIFTAEPVFGALFAMIIPNSEGITESLGLTTAAGCALILTGMLISEFRQTKIVRKNQ